MGRRRLPTPTWIAALLLLFAGCGGGTSSQGGARGPSDRLGEADLESVPQLSAFQAIQRLRPRWLNTRTGATPMVHVDGNIQMGGADALHNLRAADVQEMRYLNAADATTRFGTNYVSGVILVTTKR